MEQSKQKSIVIPIIAIVVFTLLVFSAAYAYFNGNNSLNAANYEFEMPRTTTLICSKTDCGANVTPLMMEETNTNASTAKSTQTCSLNCTCSGSQGATCNYNVRLLQAGATYVPSSGLGTNKEFTVTVTSPLGPGCVAQNGSGSGPIQVNTLAGKTVSTCNLTVPASGSVSANVTAVFKWYNLDLNQGAHAGTKYKYALTSDDSYSPCGVGNEDIPYDSNEHDGHIYRNTTDISYDGDNINEVLLSGYETNLNNINTDFYIKHYLESNIIQDTYICFKSTDGCSINQTCLHVGDSSYYGSYTGMSSTTVSSVTGATGNIERVQSIQNFVVGEGGSCTYQDSYSACYGFTISLTASAYGGGEANNGLGDWCEMIDNMASCTFTSGNY